MTSLERTASRRSSGYYGRAMRTANGLVEGMIPPSRLRIWPFRLIFMLIMAVLLGRLMQLTLVEGRYRYVLAEGNRMVEVRKAGLRGVFVDRYGEPLVRNIPQYKRQVVGTTLAQAQFEPLTHEQAMQVMRQPGERLFFDVSRDYVCPQACAHVLGYVGEISRDELSSRSREGYVMGDQMGRYGLEQVMEQRLRGEAGRELIEVDALGNRVRDVGLEESVAGMNIQLALDPQLSQVLYEALAGRPGSAVAQHPKTGEVYALVSSPAFDANKVADYLTAEGLPFFDRALGGTYPPGSVFKMVTAAAALETGAITPETTFVDTGEIVINEFRFGTWLYDRTGGTEGALNIVQALKRSNDIYFYRMGEATGAQAMADYARLFGFESTAGLEAMGAKPGIIPDPLWKERYKGEKWYLGNTYHMSIGQGDVLVTPLQVNRMMGAIANNGVLCPVRLEAGEVKESCVQMNLSSTTLDTIKQALVEVCSPGGTSGIFIDFVVKVACKTGTAEHIPKDALPHAWYTIYAPVEDPEIVLTVMVEESGDGSAIAAPIAKKGLEYWFGDRKVESVDQ